MADEGECDGVCVAADKNEDGSVGQGTDISHVIHVAVSTGRCYGDTGAMSNQVVESGRLTGGLRKARLPVSVCYSLPQRFRNSAISSIRCSSIPASRAISCCDSSLISSLFIRRVISSWK